MKAMIWKELRENAKWAVLAMIGLTLAEIYGLYYFDPMNYNNRGITLCNPTFLMATALGNAVVGLMLGFVQILPEQRRDQWAALLHRPVSRGVIFRGKVAAGILLYLLATLPPFLLCLWLAATPGHFVAPFVPELALPALSDLFVGLAYYFAALVTALQRGSWFGARSFALLAAVGLSCALSGLHYFYVAVEAALILAALLFAAAWGAMLSNGKFSDRPRLAQAALLLVVLFGVCGVGVLGIILMNAGQQYSPFIGSEYKITKDGQPFIFRVKDDLTTTVTDLAGQPLPDASLYVGNRGYQNEIQAYELAQLSDPSHATNFLDEYYDYRASRTYVEEIEQYSQMEPTQWFFLDTSNYVIGIDRRSKRPADILDRSGFHPVGQPVVPFTGSGGIHYSSPCIFIEGSDVYFCSLDKQQMLKLPSNDTAPVRGVEFRQYLPANGKGYDQIIAVARADGVQVYDSNGAPLVSLAFDPKIDLERWGMLNFGTNNSATRFYFRYDPSYWLPWAERSKMPSYLQEVDATGAMLHAYTLPPLPRSPYVRTWEQYLSEGLRSPTFWFWDLAYKKIGASLGIKRLVTQADSTFRTDWHSTVNVSERIVLFSLASALIALVWARRAGMELPRALAWTGFAFAFNFAGLITFRAVADWPVQVRCPSCQRSRRVEDAVCGHCQAAWPTPARNGLDIFDTPAPTPVAEAPRTA